MKRLTVSVLLASVIAVSAWAAPPRASGNSSDIEAVKQVGQDMGDAMIALDVEKLDQIFGDDWMTIGLTGSITNKETLLRNIKSGKKKLTWFELGPMDVQIFGDVALVQGDVAEKRTTDGKEVTVNLVYSDILKKRDGRWVVVRSMGAPIE